MSWTKDEGYYEIYLDGALNVHGHNLSRSMPIAAEGIFIIGQEQDEFGGKKEVSKSIAISYFWRSALFKII